MSLFFNIPLAVQELFHFNTIYGVFRLSTYTHVSFYWYNGITIFTLIIRSTDFIYSGIIVVESNLFEVFLCINRD